MFRWLTSLNETCHLPLAMPTLSMLSVRMIKNDGFAMMMMMMINVLEFGLSTILCLFFIGNRLPFNQSSFRDGGKFLCLQELAAGENINKQTNFKKSNTYDFAANNNNENIIKQVRKLKKNQIQMILQPPAGGELPKLYREEEACVQETSQLK